jgi:DNA-binding CsgD family transcriptional regulator
VLSWQVLVNEHVHAQLVDRIVAKSGRLQQLRGPAGVGKTTLAASVARRLETQGFGILPIFGLRELSAIPLAALTPLLILAGDVPAEPLAERLRRLFTYVASVGSKQVLMIDDGPLLDDITASTVYQLVRVYGMRAIMTARSDQSLGGPLERMHDEGLVETVEIDGLRPEDARTIVQHAFGAVVEPDSLRKLTDMAAGNPLFLRELVMAAAEKNAVRGGPLGLVVDTGALPAGLRDSISERFAALSPADRRLCELIALAEPLAPEALGGREVVVRLERTSLILRDYTGAVSLAHPLFTECLIESMSPETADVRRIEAAELVRARGGDQSRFKADYILLDTSEPPSPAELVWAARYAHSVDDHALALAFVERSVETEVTARALLVRATSLSSLGRLDEADAAFAAVRAVAVEPIDLARFASLYGFHMWMRRQRPDVSLAVGREILAALPDSPTKELLAIDVQKWAFIAGDQGEGRASTSADPTDSGGILNEVISELMEAIVSSELVRLNAAIDRGRPLVEGTRELIPHASRVIEFTAFLGIALDGRFVEAAAFAEEHRSDPFVESAGSWSYGLAIIALTAGRVAEALDIAALAVEQLRWRDFTGMLATSVAIEANAAIQLGMDARADLLLASIDDAATVDMQAALQVAEARAWRLARDGDSATAADVIADAVRKGLTRRYHAIACMSAYVAVRIGRADVVIELMRECGTLAEGGMCDAMIAHAEASVAGDPDALMKAAHLLALAGIPTGAVDAAREAAGLFRSTGRDDHARAASVRAAGWAQGLSGVRPGDTGSDSLDLTEREWAVAVAAAGRERSREIAERLGVSVRTIDNHLRSIYRKLGVAGRDELRAELFVLNL